MSTLPFIIIKLGGSSQCKEGYNALINYINDEYITNIHKSNIVLVLSAPSKVTNLLDLYTKTKDVIYIHNVDDICTDLLDSLYTELNDINGIKKQNILSKYKIEMDKLDKLISEYTNLDDIRKRAEIIGFGEKLSTTIFTNYLSEFPGALEKLNIQELNSYDFIKSNKETYKLYPTVEFCGDNNIFLKKCFEKIDTLDKDKDNIFITQGFIGSSPLGEPLLLGRGGSDTTGALIANMVDAEKYEVWTDVEGIYSADPRITNKYKLIKNISYDLVQELAAMGAKVMHPLSIIPCQVKSIPIYVKSTFNLDGNFTKIHSEDFNDVCIAIQKDVSVFHIKSMNMWNSYGFVNDIFRRFSQNQVDVNIITTSQFSISTTTNEVNVYVLKDLEQELSKDYETTLVQKCVIVSFISNNIRNIMNKLNFESLNTEIIHIGSNNLSINIVLKEKSDFELKEIIENILN